MAFPAALAIPQVIGLGTTLASQFANKAERRDKRIAGGGNDPALDSIRRQLADQNARAATQASIDARQFAVGRTPAEQARNAQRGRQAAQAGIAQGTQQTQNQLSQMQFQSAMQSREADRSGSRARMTRALGGLGQGLNVLGAFMGSSAPSRESGGGLSAPQPAVNKNLMVPKVVPSRGPAPLPSDGVMMLPEDPSTPSQIAPPTVAQPTPVTMSMRGLESPAQVVPGLGVQQTPPGAVSYMQYRPAFEGVPVQERPIPMTPQMQSDTNMGGTDELSAIETLMAETGLPEDIAAQIVRARIGRLSAPSY